MLTITQHRSVYKESQPPISRTQMPNAILASCLLAIFFVSAVSSENREAAIRIALSSPTATVTVPRPSSMHLRQMPGTLPSRCAGFLAPNQPAVLDHGADSLTHACIDPSAPVNSPHHRRWSAKSSPSPSNGAATVDTSGSCWTAFPPSSSL